MWHPWKAQRGKKQGSAKASQSKNAIWAIVRLQRERKKSSMRWEGREGTCIRIEKVKEKGG